MVLLTALFIVTFGAMLIIFIKVLKKSRIGSGSDSDSIAFFIKILLGIALVANVAAYVMFVFDIDSFTILAFFATWGACFGLCFFGFAIIGVFISLSCG